MLHLKKLSIIILFILIAILGFFAVQNIIGNYNYSQSTNLTTQSAESVVYIENGVTGVVVITDPFLNRTTAIDVIYYPLDTGSGFIVNSNGYVITALHVVGDLNSLNNQTLKTMNSDDVKLYIERAAVSGYISEYNPQLNSQLSNNITGTSHVELNSNSTTDILIQKSLLNVQSAQQLIKIKLPGINNTNLNASIIDVGNASRDEDVALLKIDTPVKNLPSLAISSKSPEIFEGLHIFGYPGIDNAVNTGINHAIIKPDSSTGLLTSETYKNGTSPEIFNINSVYDNLVDWFMIIFSPKTSGNGTLYYGTSAMTSEGYSGGPVVDSQNHVLGIIIFSIESNDKFKQQLKLTSSLFLSSQYIIQICKKNNIPINMV
jgi:Trypsin-like peptidase domain